MVNLVLKIGLLKAITSTENCDANKQGRHHDLGLGSRVQNYFVSLNLFIFISPFLALWGYIIVQSHYCYHSSRFSN